MGNKLQPGTTQCCNKVLGHDTLSGQNLEINSARSEDLVTAKVIAHDLHNFHTSNYSVGHCVLWIGT